MSTNPFSRPDRMTPEWFDQVFTEDVTSILPENKNIKKGIAAYIRSQDPTYISKLKAAAASDETKQKLSGLHKGKKRNKQTIEKMSIAAKGNINNLGKKRGIETRKKLSQKSKAYYQSAEGQEKLKEIIAIHKGCIRSEETKQKLREAWIKRKRENPPKPMSEETKQKLSKAKKGCISHNKGKPMSEEQKQKLREAHARRRAAKLNGSQP